jgi:methionine-rich copper-binding protein CopC
MRKIFAISLALIFTQLSAGHALAHAQLTASFPIQNKVVKVLPKYVWVEFDGDLMTFGDKNPNSIKVIDSKMKRVDIGGSIAGGARVSTQIKSGLKPGRYKVSYRIVSEDGHPVEGSFFFTYRP